jgi:hypothetical protein
MDEQEKLNDYDSEPVRYCARCYSLKIKYDETLDSEYCGDCGCSDTIEAPIEEWEKKYERRYGKKFAEKQEDPKKTFIFRMPLEKIKSKVYNSPKWREIIKAIYPRFPGGYGKADSILLFFDTLVKQNRLDELKLFLFKHFKI